MKVDRWTFPMMIIMAGRSDTEAFLRFKSGAMTTLRVAAYPPTPIDVVQAAQRDPSVLDRWCEDNADPGAAAFHMVRYEGDMETLLSVTEASGAWFATTRPIATPLRGPEIVFRLRNIRDESRVIHIIAGLEDRT